MARLNLTLDQGTVQRLDRHARAAGAPRAALARALLEEGLARREAAARKRKLAADYSGDRRDTRELLRDLEQGELELLD